MNPTGPTTPAGKAIASRNAIRHGVLTSIPVVPGLELQEDWDSHRAGVLESLAPEGHLEIVLAERVALQFWRLHRVARYEAMAVATGQETVEEDVAGTRRRWRLGNASPAVRLADATDELERLRERVDALRHFSGMADAEPLSAADTDVLLSTVEAVTRETRRGSIPVPFIPEGVAVDEYADWTAAKLRWLLTAIATAEGREFDELLAAARKHVIIEFGLSQCDVADLAAEAEQDRVESAAQVEREQRERLLPSEPVMEKVTRYEAHLSRELYKAMHELEALQARRRGHPSPLARLDIDVTALPENPTLRNELPA